MLTRRKFLGWVLKATGALAVGKLLATELEPGAEVPVPMHPNDPLGTMPVGRGSPHILDNWGVRVVDTGQTTWASTDGSTDTQWIHIPSTETIHTFHLPSYWVDWEQGGG